MRKSRARAVEANILQERREEERRDAQVAPQAKLERWAEGGERERFKQRATRVNARRTMHRHDTDTEKERERE